MMRMGPVSAGDALQASAQNSWGGSSGLRHLNANLQELSSWLTSGSTYYTFTVLSTEPHHVRAQTDWNYLVFPTGNQSGLQLKPKDCFKESQGNDVAVKRTPFPFDLFHYF